MGRSKALSWCWVGRCSGRVQGAPASGRATACINALQPASKRIAGKESGAHASSSVCALSERFGLALAASSRALSFEARRGQLKRGILKYDMLKKGMNKI